ncbi:MAG TPA: hypothetical protein VF665_11525 [Longimicrobium sp.]|jgi:hypothetical protein|uniref:hypothetical protein n=1 Tax=Longimicrobium sp. TaxID=2029185 RepID=UPI002EDB5C62
MKTYPRSRVVLAALALLAACERSPSGGGGVPTEELIFLRASPNAPQVAAVHAELVAVQGQNSEVRLRYQPLPGQSSGEDLLRFRVSGNTRMRRPDGTALRDGESIRITLDFPDPSRFDFRFEPSGMRFENEPAELRVSYAFANPDFNADGRVDARDDDFDFGFWRQEAPGQDWTRIGDLRVKDLEEVRGEITGFTGYALAGGTRQAR